ncbi:hypothetical protein BJ508DRAFT_380083 [Ascobolus immersus RN42]|uniref:CAP-Gly domain-containing protein n=1 Tax=Ascobolus immersus RN42 TaxID=1160509 RepID=A0A3N4HNI6_ASCIM|nr:hypothetical protein BJ508DRAFT_380083 [Ascobolus immersus RN42]
MTERFRIGQRISFSPSLCTIRYIGPVEGTAGTWLGVEWDDPTRGKHSGEHGGHQYFSVRIPGSGSFIRPTRKPDPRTTFLEAVKSKYAPEAKEDKGEPKPVVFGTKIAEEIGFTKAARQFAELGKLSIVVVDGMGIEGGDKIESPEEIERTIGNVRELDLSRNLFSSIEDVARICIALKGLRILKLNGLRFSDLFVPVDLRPAFTNLTELQLSYTLLTPTELEHLLSYFPALQTLHLKHNHLTTVPHPPHPLLHLDLTHNGLTISSLSPLAPGPGTLIISANDISTLEPPCDPPLSNTTTLTLTHNILPKPAALDPLPLSFPNLHSLRVTHNPLFPSPPPSALETTPQLEEQYRRDRDLAQTLVIARLDDGVKELNFGRIGEEERQQAELYYINLIAKEIISLGGGEAVEAEIVRHHRRWHLLCERHGKPNIEVGKTEVKVGKASLGASLIRVEVQLDLENKGSSEEKVELELPRGTTIARTLNIIAKHWPEAAIGKVKLLVEGEGGVYGNCVGVESSGKDLKGFLGDVRVVRVIGEGVEVGGEGGVGGFTDLEH